MIEKSFVDTNVLLYSFDWRNASKQAVASTLIRKLERESTLVLSTQVLQEFYVAATHPRKVALSRDLAEATVGDLQKHAVVQITPHLVVSAIRRHRADVLSFWDALIVEAAIAGECSILYSEDLNDGQVYGPVRVVDPFA